MNTANFLLMVQLIVGQSAPTYVLVTEAQCRAVVQSHKQPKTAQGLPRVGAACYAPDGKIIAATGM